jgi:hypothetical protein
MTAIDHHNWLLALLFQRCLCRLYISRAVIGSLGSSTKNHEAVLIARSAGNRGKTLLGYAHEMVRMGGGEYGINGNGQGAVGTVLETHREGYTRGKFAMELRLSGASANGCEGQEICQELYRLPLL